MGHVGKFPPLIQNTNIPSHPGEIKDPVEFHMAVISTFQITHSTAPPTFIYHFLRCLLVKCIKCNN